MKRAWLPTALTVACLAMSGCGGSERKVRKLEEDLRAAEGRVRQLEGQLTVAANASRVLQDEMRGWRLQLDDLHAEDDLVKRERDDLRGRLAWTERNLQNAREMLKAHDAVLKKVTSDQAARLLADGNNALRKEIDVLERRLQAVERERDRLYRLCKAHGLDPDTKPETPKKPE